MIAATMLGAIAVGLLLSLAGEAGARALSATARPTRWCWTTAMTATVLWTIGALLHLTHPLARLSPVAVDLVPAGLRQLSAAVVHGARTPRSPSPELLLLLLWVLASTFLLARLGRSLLRVDRLTRGWTVARVDGIPVRLSPERGPAVVGLRSMEIVLPEWALALDTPLRALVLRHETEHVAARDPWLLFASALLTAALPWNPVLWWLARRLRLAIEVDCDARVLRVDPRPERYGLLLLAMAQRRSAGPPLLAPALSESMSELERRIVAMRNAASRISRPRLVALSLVAAGAVVLACSVDAPERPSARTEAGARTNALPRTAAEPYLEFQVERQVAGLPGQPAPRYPDPLREARTEGEVLTQFVVDTSGRPEMGTLKVLKSSHELFAKSVKDALPRMRFSPAVVGGRRVRQVVQMPFVFSLSKE